MASFVSTAACPMLTLPTAAATRVRITAFQQTSFSTSASPVFCGLRSSAPKVEFLKAANISSNRSRYFKSAVSCSAAQSETLQTVQSTIAKQLSIDVSTVTPDTKFADLGADSLDTVEIMMALEEQFEVSIGEGGAENIATVQDAADLIEKVKAASS